MSAQDRLMKRIVRARGEAGTPQRPIQTKPAQLPGISDAVQPTKPTLPAGLRSSAPSAAGNRGSIGGGVLGGRKRRRLQS